MFVVDDILLSPIKGLFWVFQEIHNAVEQEVLDEGEAITQELTDLYMMLETEKITEEEFEAREKELLDRLDSLDENNSND